MVKDLVLGVTSTLPDTASFDDIIEAIYIRLKVEKGIEDSKNNKELTTDELLEEMKKW